MLPVNLAIDRQRVDQNDIQVQRLLDRGDWKAAIRYIDRIMKKKSSFRLQVNRCLISLVSGDVDKTFEGLNALRKLIEAKSIMDLEIISAVDKSIPGFVLDYQPEVIMNLWKYASKAFPKDTKLMEAWFDSCCSRKDYVQASIIAIQASKTLDSKHDYYWRAIICRSLDSNFGNHETRQLSGNMSVALVKECLKAMSITNSHAGSKDDNTETGKNTIDPKSIAIQSTAELILALRLYEYQDRIEEALVVLDDKSNTGLRSNLGQGDWQLVRTKIKFLAELDKYEELWKFCYQLLCDAAEIDSNQDNIAPYSYGSAADDIFVWFSAVRSCCQLHDDKLVEKLKILMSHSNLQKRHRLLAEIYLYHKLGEQDSNVVILELFWKLIHSYIKQYIATEVAYLDLRFLAEYFSQNECEKVLTLLKQEQQLLVSGHNKPDRTTYIHATLNLYKFKYTVKISNPNKDWDRNTMKAFAVRCLNLYSLSLLDQKKQSLERGTGDEAAILAACTLIHMAGDKRGGHEIQAVLILEMLLEHSGLHSGALVLLIRLYVRQGIWSKAYEHYQKLDVKNIQIWTESWLLLGRAASIFPYHKEGQNHELYGLLNKYAKYVQGKRQWDEDNIILYKAQKDYLGLYDVYEFIERCRHSISKPAIFAELSRLNVRNGVGSIADGDVTLQILDTIAATTTYEGSHIDLRSSSGFPNYEHVHAIHLETYTAVGPPSGDDWIAYEQLMFRWRRWLVQGERMPRTHEEHKEAAQNFLDDCKGVHKSYALKESDIDMTRTEILVAMVITVLSAVQESSFACQEANKAERQGRVSNEFDWMSDYLGPYELTWKQCRMVMETYLENVKKVADEFHHEPVEEFGASPWRMLHNYYKATEVFMIYPSFLSGIIGRGVVLREVAKAKGIPLESYDCLNVVALEAHMRTFLSTAVQIINLYHEGACHALRELEPAEMLTQAMTLGARGGTRQSKLRKNIERLFDQKWTEEKLRKSFERLFDQKWTEEKLRPVSEGYKLSLKGIAIEDSEHWWKRYWSKQALYM